jgi:uncharacterized protein
MVVGVLRIRLRLQAGSLKEKRTVVKSVVERVRGRFNAAVAEVDDLDTWDLATIGVVCISNEARHADRELQTIARQIEGWRLDAEVLEIATEIIPL